MKKYIFQDKFIKAVVKYTIEKLDRTTWLKRQLQLYCSPDDLKGLSSIRPDQCISPAILEHIANNVITDYIQISTLISSGSSLISRKALTLGIPLDIISFYCNLITLTTKLSYLYGWESCIKNKKVTDSAIYFIYLILGYAYGDLECKNELFSAVKHSKSLSQITIENNTEWNNPTYSNACKQIFSQIIKSFTAGLINKKSPIIGCSTAAILNYYSFSLLAKKINLILKETMYLYLDSKIKH